MSPAIPIGDGVERGVDWLLDHAQPVFDAIVLVLGLLVDAIEGTLLAVPSTLVVVILFAFAGWRVSVRFAAFVALALALVVGMGLWTAAMSTLALVLSATAVGLAIGLPLGIAAGRSDRVDRALRPVLDFMQTMPAFVYLIPAAMFFGLGRVPGLVATFIFAMPPSVRLTSLGIRQVPTELAEAGLAFGCTERQLLVRVLIPSALPSIMAGVNQTIMLSLSMVVIASMIGAGGLGDAVLQGIQRLDVGLGFEAGLGVVLVAVLLDRITQSFGKHRPDPWRERWASWRAAEGRPARWATSGVAVAAALASVVYVGRLELERPPPVVASRPAPGAPSAASEVIRVGWTAWSDAELVAHLTERILQERLDQPVALRMADIGLQYQGIASGQLDVMLMGWLPTTHGPYWEQVASDVTNLGPLYTRARLGWAVPAYVPESEVKTLADLKKPAVVEHLGGRIVGIDPGSGLMQASERAIDHYDLSSYQLVAASGSGMTASLDRAVRRHEWVVVTAWSPHWMFSRYPLRYLEDPDRVLGGRERVHALARRGFYQDFPAAVSETLMRMFIPLDELEAMMLDASDRSVDEAVATYLEEHADRVDYWVTGEVAGERAER